MCTLTYFPYKNGYIFTHNRDEDKMREPAWHPQIYTIHGIEIIMPKDGRAGGTWMAASAQKSICLLNGAFEKHSHRPPYRLSRGIVLLDIFSFETLADFARDYNLEGIEPFTIVCAENSGELAEFRWDGNQKYLKPLPQKPAIWSSATLYDEEAQLQRQLIFDAFVQNHPQPDIDSILHFHQTGKTGVHENDLIMERASGVMTLAISQIIYTGQTRFEYYDRILHTHSAISL